MNKKIKTSPVAIADTIARLFANCQEKESRFVADFGVSLVEFRCLRILNEHEQLTVNQLAQKMSLTSSRITRIIDGLVEKALVVRESGKSDRRVYLQRLTPEGKKLSDNLNQKYSNIHQEILSTIPAEKHQPLMEAINQLNDAVETWLNRADS